MTLRVLQVLHQGGGAGSVTSTLHLSLGLARTGVAVSFVCPPGSEVESQARAGGLEVVPLALRPRARRANAAALGALLADRPVDLVSSQSARDRQALTWLALRGRLGPPLVVTRRQMPRTFFLQNWATSRVASRVIAVSRAVAAALSGNLLAGPHGGAHTGRLPVGAPTHACSAATRGLRLSHRNGP